MRGRDGLRRTCCSCPVSAPVGTLRAAAQQSLPPCECYRLFARARRMLRRDQMQARFAGLAAVIELACRACPFDQAPPPLVPTILTRAISRPLGSEPSPARLASAHCHACRCRSRPALPPALGPRHAALTRQELARRAATAASARSSGRAICRPGLSLREPCRRPRRCGGPGASAAHRRR